MERLIALIVKEFWAMVRDAKMRIVLIGLPVMQLLIFAFAVTLEVKNADIAIYDQSDGHYSSEIINRIAGSPYFRGIVRLNSYDEVRNAINRQKVIAALVIDSDFDAKRQRGTPTTVNLLLDGRRSNSAQILASYLQDIVTKAGMPVTMADRDVTPGSIRRNWFNPNLSYYWFDLPCLLVLVVSVSSLAVTAQSVAREREMGTFDQLLVSPLRLPELLIGKMIPPMAISFLHGTIFLIVAQVVFGVPFTGSLLLFYLSLLIYMLALIGIGMFISAISKTQQQAFLGAFMAIVPLVVLSGFASPVENMPEWLQLLTYLDPARYFMEISLGLFLKAMPLSQVLERLWPLLLISIATLGTATWLFRARME